MTDAEVTTTVRSAPHHGTPIPARLTLVAALLGFFMICLDATAVNVALPAIGHSLHGATDGLQWVVDGYTVPFAALLISAGSVSDRAGARRVFGWGLALFTAASAGCGFAPALWVLIGSRVVQGGAAALTLPASLSLVRQAFDEPAARARAVAVWNTGGAAAIAAGPVLGGVLTSAAGWRAIFFINLPVGAVTLVLAARAPRSLRLAAPLDLPGQVTAIATLAALAAGVISGGANGFTSPSALAALGVAVLAAAAFVVAESTVRRPMVPLTLLRSPGVAAYLLTGFSINVAFYGIAFVLSLYFQRVLGEPPIVAGLLFLPMTGLLTVASLASARVAARWGHHLPLRLGLITSTLGLILLVFLRGRTSLEIALIPAGAGLGFALPSLTFLLLDALPAAQAGLAGGLFNAARQTGGALAVAVFGALISASFPAGMRQALLISVALLAASTATVLARPGKRAGPRPGEMSEQVVSRRP
jgi:MFS transporter, DHA2 family, methylenomycin A resistance protein